MKTGSIKKHLLLMLLITLYSVLSAQNCRVVEQSDGYIVIGFNSGTLSSKTIEANGSLFSTLSIEGFGSSMLKGAPQLPVMSRFISAPVCTRMSVTVVSSDYEEFDCAAIGVEHSVLPSQGSVSKAIKHPAFFVDDSIYLRNAYFSLPLVSVSESGIYRDAHVAGINFSPVAYNPVSHKIRICTNAVVRVDFEGVDKGKTSKIDAYYSEMFGIDEKMLVNNASPNRSEYTSSPISYLVVAHSMFRQNQELEDFIDWKRKLGYVVKVAYTDDPEVGTSCNSIKNYIKSCFDNASDYDPAPLFLLLVGDNEQIPAFDGTTDDGYHVTDLYYATQVGNDYLPDCYYGRLSAQNQADLSNQIAKILMYEQFAMPDPSYLGNAVLIAGYDKYYGPRHANGQVNYINQNYINVQNPRYQGVKVHLHDCSSQSALIRSEIGQGAGWVNYTAHGTEDSWASPLLNINQVYALQNANKCGVMIGNCCLSGKFELEQCFAEALLRAPNKGAMTYVGASNNSYWDEDFYWSVGIRNPINSTPSYQANNLGCYDRLFHSHDEAPSAFVSTIGGVINAGNMSVQNSSSDLKNYYWEIYHCFGDPSVRAYLGIPSVLEPNYPAAVLFGETELNVVTQPFAYVAITGQEGVACAAFADQNGLAVLNLSNIQSPGNYQIAISAQNHVPYFGEFLVIMPDVPFVVSKKTQFSENTDFLTADNADIDIKLENVGGDAASDVYAVLSSENPDIIVTKDSVFIGSLASNSTSFVESAFSFSILGEIKDNTTLYFDLDIHWDTVSMKRKVMLKVAVPEIVLQNVVSKVQEVPVKAVNPGDVVSFVFTSKNTGHANLSSGITDLTCNYSGATVISPSSPIGNIAQFESFEKTFEVEVSEQVQPKSVIPFYFHTIYGSKHVVDTLFVAVGADMETFETADFSQYSWNMHDKPWVISSSVRHSGNYSARSAYNTGSFGLSKMSITLSSESASQISYFRKVATESYYDIFYLYMDGDVVDEASGVSDWEFVSIDVPEGTHTFEFSYEKDGNLSVDSDCVWIDDILLPSDVYVVAEDVEDNVGIENNSPQSLAKVYPNPASNLLVIESEMPVSSFLIFDLNGRTVDSGILNGNGHDFVDIGNLHSGIYFLQVKYNNNLIQNFKIIKR